MAIKSLLITTYPTSQNRMAPSEPPLANSFSCIGCHDTATESKRVSYLHTYLAVEKVGERERERAQKKTGVLHVKMLSFSYHTRI